MLFSIINFVSNVKTIIIWSRSLLGTFLLILAILFNVSLPGSAIAAEAPVRNYYRTQTIHNPDGIGKFYQDREIAKVMGHQAMAWLERDSRDRQEQPQAVIEHLPIKSQAQIADLGTGTGYFAFRIASLVPEGKVYAVDIQPEMLSVVEDLKKQNQVTNVEAVLGTETNLNLSPDSLDLALMVDAYHEFAYPQEIMSSLYQALKPGGKVILVEYRQENPMIMIKPLHKMSQKQIKKELKTANFRWQKTQEFLPEQHFMIFQKPQI